MRKLGIVLVLAIAAACSGGTQQTAAGGSGPTVAKSPPLYDRLGRRDAIVAVVDDFVANVDQDPRITLRFKSADIAKLKASLVDQICEVAGGPCKYQGKDMKTAHTGMAIKDDEFTAMVEDLQKSLDKFKVGKQEQDELLGAIGELRKNIVGL